MIARTMKAVLALTLIPCCAWTVVTQLPTPNASEVSVWYAKWFGAKPRQSDACSIGVISGAHIVFHGTREPIGPTEGRSHALLGFIVKDLRSFVRRYQNAGGKLDGNAAVY